MPRTHFSGPITAGSIRDTSGVTVGVDVSNRGYATLTQVAKITETGVAQAINIVIPANSTIVAISSYAETDFASQLSLGVTAAANELVTDGICAAGVTQINASTDICAMVWLNTGPNDLQVYAKSAASGIGVGYISVTYAQALNFVE